MYSKLYDPNTKIIARTTVRENQLSPFMDRRLLTCFQTQDRMLKSAENFMAGFFGLDWWVMNAAHVNWHPTDPLLGRRMQRSR